MMSFDSSLIPHTFSVLVFVFLTYTHPIQLLYRHDCIASCIKISVRFSTGSTVTTPMPLVECRLPHLTITRQDGAKVFYLLKSINLKRRTEMVR